MLNIYLSELIITNDRKRNDKPSVTQLKFVLYMFCFWSESEQLILINEHKNVNSLRNCSDDTFS